MLFFIFCCRDILPSFQVSPVIPGPSPEQPERTFFQQASEVSVCKGNQLSENYAWNFLYLQSQPDSNKFVPGTQTDRQYFHLDVVLDWPVSRPLPRLTIVLGISCTFPGLVPMKTWWMRQLSTFPRVGVCFPTTCTFTVSWLCIKYAFVSEPPLLCLCV